MRRLGKAVEVELLGPPVRTPRQGPDLARYCDQLHDRIVELGGRVVRLEARLAAWERRGEKEGEHE
jgi:hypothetical protein